MPCLRPLKRLWSEGQTVANGEMPAERIGQQVFAYLDFMGALDLALTGLRGEQQGGQVDSFPGR